LPFRGPNKKSTVLTLVDRDGDSHSFHIANVKAKTLRETIVKVASRKSYLATDALASYETLGRKFSGHGSVDHSEEYVRLGGFIHVNTPECVSALRSARFSARTIRSAKPICRAISRNGISSGILARWQTGNVR